MTGGDREAVETEIARLQEWFHQAEDMGGNLWSPSARTVEAKRSRFSDLLVLLGEDRSLADASADILRSTTHRAPNTTIPLSETGTLVLTQSISRFHEIRAETVRDGDGLLPVRLVDPGPEAEAERQVLLELLSDPALTPHSNHVVEDSLDDLAANFVFKLYEQQNELLVGTVLDRPIEPYHSFCQWFFARSILYGYRNIHHFLPLLEEAYPDLPRLDPSNLSTAVYKQRLLEEKDPAWLDCLARSADPAMLPHIGALMESYMDLVNAQRVDDVASAADLPEMHRPDVRKHGFARYKRRVLTAYQRLGNADKVARAFQADVRRTRAWLKKADVMSGYATLPAGNGVVSARQTTPATTTRQRRRY